MHRGHGTAADVFFDLIAGDMYGFAPWSNLSVEYSNSSFYRGGRQLIRGSGSTFPPLPDYSVV